MSPELGPESPERSDSPFFPNPEIYGYNITHGNYPRVNIAARRAGLALGRVHLAAPSPQETLAVSIQSIGVRSASHVAVALSALLRAAKEPASCVLSSVICLDLGTVHRYRRRRYRRRRRRVEGGEAGGEGNVDGESVVGESVVGRRESDVFVSEVPADSAGEQGEDSDGADAAASDIPHAADAATRDFLVVFHEPSLPLTARAATELVTTLPATAAPVVLCAADEPAAGVCQCVRVGEHAVKDVPSVGGVPRAAQTTDARFATASRIECAAALAPREASARLEKQARESGLVEPGPAVEGEVEGDVESSSGAPTLVEQISGHLDAAQALGSKLIDSAREKADKVDLDKSTKSILGLMAMGAAVMLCMTLICVCRRGRRRQMTSMGNEMDEVAAE